MPSLNNNDRIRQIVDALGELNACVVYVGGAVIQLYSTDKAAGSPTTTYDVDCVVDITSYREYQEFEGKIREKHFSNDTSEGAPICRYLFNGEKVDFMPKVDTGIGESNRWYLKGLAYRQKYRLDEKRTIFIMPVSFYLASKLEALHDRGGEDYRGAKDFEDIVYVLNTCVNLSEEICAVEDNEVRDYLRNEFRALLERTNILEEVSCALLEEGRTDHVMDAVRQIANS